MPLAALVRARGNPVLSFLVPAAVNLVVFAGLLAGLGVRWRGLKEVRRWVAAG